MSQHGKSRIAPWLVLAGSLVASLASPVMAQSSEEKAARWLERMGNALRERNYQGTFTYMRGSDFETVRIVHKVENGSEVERLFNLNGEVRELYRHDDEVLCFHPQSDAATVDDIEDHIVQIGPFTPRFSERVLSAQSLYRLSMHGSDRIAGRDAVKVAVSPRFDDRYGYRLWLDEETGIMLQSHLVERGRVKEIFQFTSLEVGGPVSSDLLASAIEGETVSHPLSLDDSDISEKPVWRVAWLPDGFQQIRVQGNRLHFSDGVATFSVFVEQPDSADLPDMTTTMGGTVVITKRLRGDNGSQVKGPQVTVVGEVPVQTARRVADSVEPVIY